METFSELWMWFGFTILISIVILVDLFLFSGRKGHATSVREALAWTIVWITLALAFNLLLWWYLAQTQGPIIAQKKALEFFTGYLIEKSLSVDNLFVFSMIFSYFSVPLLYQRRVLLYGILCAVVMRIIIILVGLWFVSKFHWILYLFGLFLVITGVHMLFAKKEKPNLNKNPIVNWLRKHIRISDDFHNENFFVRQKGVLFATPLFLVLILIELSDLVFATDSIPAIFAITNDPFIVFTSNIFAILGLRSLYFLLAQMVDRFSLLQYGLALILIFVGCKMLIAPWYPIPIVVTLGVISIVLLSFILLSMIYTSNQDSKH